MHSTFRRIVSIHPLGGYRLRLVYDIGGIADVDFSSSVERGGVCAPLANPAFFAQAFIGDGGRSLEWPGDVGFCADALWFEAHPEDYAAYRREIEEQRGQPVADR